MGRSFLGRTKDQVGILRHGDSSVSVSVSSYTVPATEMEREEGYTEE